MRRDYTYDWLRIIATIFVVVGHSAYLNLLTPYGGVEYVLTESVNAAYYSPLLKSLRFLSGWVYGFHMPLFFMLSGAVFALKPLATMDNIVKAKIKRLLIPYYLCGWLFMLPVKYLGNFYSNATISEAMKAFLSSDESGHLWFLTALFWVFIVAAMLLKLLNRFGINSVYIFLFLCGFIQLTYQHLPFYILGMNNAFPYMFWFALGFVFETERRRHKPWNVRATIFTILILLILEFANVQFSVLNSFFQIVVGSFLAFLVADLLNRIFPGAVHSSAWKILTRNCMYIYLFHDPMEYIVLRLFMNGHWLDSAIGCYLYVFCRLIVTIFVSILLGECVRVIKGKVAPALAH